MSSPNIRDRGVAAVNDFHMPTTLVYRRHVLSTYCIAKIIILVLLFLFWLERAFCVRRVDSSAKCMEAQVVDTKYLVKKQQL